MDDLQRYVGLLKTILGVIVPLLRPTFGRRTGMVAILVALVVVYVVVILASSRSAQTAANPTPEPTITVGQPAATDATVSATRQVHTASPATASAAPPAANPAPPSSAIFLTRDQIIEDDGLKAVVRMTTMPTQCEWLYIEITRWHSPKTLKDYQQPMKVCSDSKIEFDRVIYVGTGDSSNCGKSYELNVVSIPDEIHTSWKQQYIDQGRPIEAQPEPDGARRVTNMGLTVTIGGPRCAKATPTLVRMRG